MLAVQLDQLGIDYVNPSDTDPLDPDMIVSLKDLLSFSLQTCVGLVRCHKSFGDKCCTFRSTIHVPGRRYCCYGIWRHIFHGLVSDVSF